MLRDRMSPLPVTLKCLRNALRNSTRIATFKIRLNDKREVFSQPRLHGRWIGLDWACACANPSPRYDCSAVINSLVLFARSCIFKRKLRSTNITGFLESSTGDPTPVPRNQEANEAFFIAFGHVAHHGSIMHLITKVGCLPWHLKVLVHPRAKRPPKPPHKTSSCTLIHDLLFLLHSYTSVSQNFLNIIDPSLTRSGLPYIDRPWLRPRPRYSYSPD